MKHELLSIKEIALILGVCTETVRGLLRKGMGPPFLKVSSKIVRIERTAFEQWIADRTS